jgi:hypothetical protein
MRLAPLLLAILLAPAPAIAGLDETADTAGCVAASIAAGQPAAQCVAPAQAPCFAFEEDSPAGTACFLEARAGWSARIAARMAEIRAEAPPEIAAIAAVEAKYDVLQNLTQCARMEELAAIRDLPSLRIPWQDARCEATAIGLAYVKLLLQSRDLN